jgi:integrase
MSASSAKSARKLIADLPKGVSARWVTDGTGRRSVCIRVGSKYMGLKGASKVSSKQAGEGSPEPDQNKEKENDGAFRKYFPTRQKAEEWWNGPEAKKLKADSTGFVKIGDVAKEVGVAKEHLDPDELRKAIMAYRMATDHGVSVSEAVVEKIKKIAPGGKPRTLREACNEVIQNRETNKLSDRHLKLMRGIYDAFCVKLGKRPIHEIDYDELNAWRSSRSDLSLRTMRSYFTYLSIVFRRGVKRGWCTENPAAEIKSEIKETPGEVTIITADAMARLLGAAMHLRKELVAPLALKAFAGLRTSELRRLTWAEVGESAVYVPPRHAKTRRARRIPYLDPLPAWLAAVGSDKKPAKQLIVQMLEKPFHQGIGTLAKAAGVRLGANAIRHSFGTYHSHKHESCEQTAMMMGNSVPVVDRDYVHHRPVESDIKNWWRITPVLARKAYAKHLAVKKVGTAVAKKKRSKEARILFVKKKAAKKARKAKSRAPKGRGAHKSRR